MNKTALAVLLLSLLPLGATTIPSTTECRNEWHRVLGDPNSGVSKTQDMVKKMSSINTALLSTSLAWRLDLALQLAHMKDMNELVWDQEFATLMANIDASINVAVPVSQALLVPLSFYTAKAEDFPTLHAMVARVAAKLDCPLPLINIAECPQLANAWVTSPSLAYKTCLLVIGSALLEAADDQGLEGILAHEFAHVAQKHTTQKVAFSVSIVMFLGILFLLLLWLFLFYFGMVDCSSRGFGLFVATCCIFGLGEGIQPLIGLLEPLYSRSIEREADRKAAEIYPEAKPYLAAGLRELKAQQDRFSQQRAKTFAFIREELALHDDLAPYVKKSMNTKLDAIEAAVAKEIATKQAGHPPIDERIALLEKE